MGIRLFWDGDGAMKSIESLSLPETPVLFHPPLLILPEFLSVLKLGLSLLSPSSALCSQRPSPLASLRCYWMCFTIN